MVRALVVSVALVGCGFRGPGLAASASDDGGAGIDSGKRDVDASVAHDDAGGAEAAVDGPPVPPDAHILVVVDTLTIPGTGGVVMSTIVPTLGATYHLRASGFVQVATGLDSDAEYWGFPGGANDFTTDNTVDMGLGIDDAVIDTVKTRWGVYTSTHVYEIAYVGTGLKLRAQYEDNFFGNNTGTMKLEILQ